MTTTYLLGLDVGTSGCKVVALGMDGATLATAESRYAMAVPQPGWAEQAPSQWWQAVRSGVARLLEQLPVDARAEGIGVTGQMHTVVLLDKAREVLRPSILWCDQRSGDQAKEITERLGADAVRRITRNPSRPAFTASKLLWVRENQPDLYQHVRHVMQPKDWIVLQLTRQLSAEPTDASGTGLFDLVTGKWSTEILNALDLDEALFSEIRGSAKIVGQLTDYGARQLGLPEGIPVVAGAGDVAAAAYDAGAVQPGIVACSLGTSVGLTESALEPVEGSLAHVVPGQWMFHTSAHSGTVALDWWSRIVGATLGDVVGQAADSPRGSRGARFIPLLLGSRDGRPGQAGSFLDLREGHTGPDLARSVVEGIAFEVRRVAKALPAGHDEWRVFGGGARGALLVQTLADVLHTNLQIIPDASGARGAARLVADGLGFAVPDVATARARVYPQPGYDYDAGFDDYLREVA